MTCQLTFEKLPKVGLLQINQRVAAFRKVTNTTEWQLPGCVACILFEERDYMQFMGDTAVFRSGHRLGPHRRTPFLLQDIFPRPTTQLMSLHPRLADANVEQSMQWYETLWRWIGVRHVFLYDSSYFYMGSSNIRVNARLFRIFTEKEFISIYQKSGFSFNIDQSARVLSVDVVPYMSTKNIHQILRNTLVNEIRACPQLLGRWFHTGGMLGMTLRAVIDHIIMKQKWAILRYSLKALGRILQIDMDRIWPRWMSKVITDASEPSPVLMAS
jgi:hypothetical protein